MSTADIAVWLGIAPRTVCLWAECGEIPAIKIGRQWRFERAVVAVWLSQRRSNKVFLSDSHTSQPRMQN